MGLPIGWLDVTCLVPVQLDWLSEYGIPRTAAGVAMRKQQLMACGNALVWKVAATRIADLRARVTI